MARIFTPTKKQERDWKKWVASKPPVIQAMATKFDPWSLYRMKSTGHRVTIISFAENNTMTVAVTGKYNLVDFERAVFGVSPDDLEPCELPDADEMTGALMTKEQVVANLDEMRVKVRPDLWVMDENGKAVRKN